MLLLSSIIIAVIGQFSFKFGVELHKSSNDGALWLFLSPATLVGLTLYFISAILYIQSLKVIPLSIAYPSLALSYTVVVAIDSLYFGSLINKWQLLGIALIVIGVSMLWVKS